MRRPFDQPVNPGDGIVIAALGGAAQRIEVQIEQARGIALAGVLVVKPHGDGQIRLKRRRQAGRIALDDVQSRRMVEVIPFGKGAAQVAKARILAAQFALMGRSDELQSGFGFAVGMARPGVSVRCDQPFEAQPLDVGHGGVLRAVLNFDQIASAAGHQLQFDFLMFQNRHGQRRAHGFGAAGIIGNDAGGGETAQGVVDRLAAGQVDLVEIVGIAQADPVLLRTQAGLRRDIRQGRLVVLRPGFYAVARAGDLHVGAGPAGRGIFIGADKNDVVRLLVVDGGYDRLMAAADGAD